MERSKIFYVPGIISLIILPFVFTEYTNRQIKSKSYNSLRVNMADMRIIKKLNEFNPEYQGNFPPKRNYIAIVLTGNNGDNRIKLDFAQIRIREILTKNDSINGVHFHFTDDSEWWTFVESINILYKENAVTFMPLDDNIWFYHFPPDTTIVNWICGTEDVIITEPDVFYWEETWDWIKLSWKSSWELITAFTVFVAMTVISKQRKRIAI